MAGQEPVAQAASCSLPLPQRYSAPVTTGQPDAASSGCWLHDACSFQYPSSSRLGNNRPPIPTCGIPGQMQMISLAPLQPSQFKEEGLGTPPSVFAEGAQGVPIKLEAQSWDSGQDSFQVEQYIPVDSGGQQRSGDGSSSSEEHHDSLRRSSRQQGRHRGRSYSQGTEQKKVGRPIKDDRDPSAPDLTPQERRRIKRRMDNRESARRVRNKRQEELEQLQAQMELLTAKNTQLRQHTEEALEAKSTLVAQLEELDVKYREAAAENAALREEAAALRKSLQVRMSVLEAELDKRVNEPDTLPPAEPAAASSAFNSSGGLSEPLSSQDMPMAMHSSLDATMAMALFPSLNLDRGLPACPRTGSLDFLNSLFEHEDAGQPVIAI